MMFVMAQTIPEDEIQFNFNGYGDNARVFIAYPSLSVSKKVTEQTSLSGKYLIDGISGASMKSQFQVDGITSATQGSSGGGDDTPDELRHEMVLGVTQAVADATFSISGIYSVEHDYSSKTIAASGAIPFAQKNSQLGFGYTGSWDKNYPQTRDWTEDKRVNAYSLAFSQVLSKTMVGQIDLSLITNSGYLSDAYQVVQVMDGNNVILREPVHPDERTRYAAGSKTIFKVGEKSSLQLGYRFYHDSWEIDSHTLSALFQQKAFEDKFIFGYGLRSYFQSKAYFYKEHYTVDDEYLAVDSKLKDLYSNELQFKIKYFPNSESSKLSYNGLFNIYHRKTKTRDWHSRRKDLYAVIFGFGVRYNY